MAAQPPTDCQPYSGSSNKNIEASLAEKQVLNATTNETITVTGVNITYTDGICASTGGPATFTILAWCNETLPIADTQYNGQAEGDVCHPYVEITSSMGGCDILSNSMIWDYLALAAPYIGVIGIVGGLILTFKGLAIIKPSICIAGFLTSLFLTILFFYAVYASSAE